MARLGFSQHAYVEAFKETELRFEVAAKGDVPAAEASAMAAAAATLRTKTEHVKTVPCPAPASSAEEEG